MTKNIEKVNILTNFFDMTLEEESSCLPYVRQYFDSSYCEFCMNIDSWVSGWLFFYDSCTLMNWEHVCEYTLVIADNMILKQKHTKAPAEIIALEPI